ncbi:MAG: cyclic nucleotide-binding domain-containing protein [Parasphingorhabdus sp.]
MLSNKMYWLRVGVIGAALSGIAYGLLVLGDPATIFWYGLLLAVSIFQFVRLMQAERSAAFTGEEEKMVQAVFRDLDSREARKLLDEGFWIDRETGRELIQEGSAVGHLYYLARGKAEVRSAGKTVGYCQSGDLIGEGTVLTSETATGTVSLSEDSRLWCIPAPVLRNYLDKNDAVRSVIDRRIGEALKSKLRATNVALSRAGGIES